MNLVDKKDKLVKEIEELGKQKQELLSKLKDVEISIERYTGAIITLNTLIQEETDNAGDTTDSSKIEKPKMEVVK